MTCLTFFSIGVIHKQTTQHAVVVSRGRLTGMK
jgi:hypothetical protein